LLLDARDSSQPAVGGRGEKNKTPQHTQQRNKTKGEEKKRKNWADINVRAAWRGDTHTHTQTHRGADE